MTIAEVLAQELGRPVEYVNLPISDWGRVLIESVGLPEFLVAHLKAVAQDHQDGAFSAQTDVVQRIGGQAAQSFRHLGLLRGSLQARATWAILSSHSIVLLSAAATCGGA